jgi:periplasmic mercuric ion binding protein
MNITKSIITVLFLALSISSCKKNKTEANTTISGLISKKPIAENAKIETASFTINGMTCAIGCAKTIEKKLNETEGVQTATVDFDKKLGTVSFDSAIQNPDKLKKIVEAVADGTTYKVSNVKS